MEQGKITALETARAKVDEGEALKRKIEQLDDVTKFCDAEIGFMDIRINFGNDGQICLAHLLGAKETHNAFRAEIKNAALELKEKLEKQFNNMQF